MPALLNSNQDTLSSSSDSIYLSASNDMSSSNQSLSNTALPHPSDTVGGTDGSGVRSKIPKKKSQRKRKKVGTNSNSNVPNNSSSNVPSTTAITTTTVTTVTTPTDSSGSNKIPPPPPPIIETPLMNAASYADMLRKPQQPTAPSDCISESELSNNSNNETYSKNNNNVNKNLTITNTSNCTNALASTGLDTNFRNSNQANLENVEFNSNINNSISKSVIINTSSHQLSKTGDIVQFLHESTVVAENKSIINLDLSSSDTLQTLLEKTQTKRKAEPISFHQSSLRSYTIENHQSSTISSNHQKLINFFSRG